MERVSEENLQLRADKATLTKELTETLNDLFEAARERNTLRDRADVKAYERLGAENLALIERVHKLEAALAALEKINSGLEDALEDARYGYDE